MTPPGNAFLFKNGPPKPINILKMTPSKMAPPPPPTGKKRPDPHQGCALRKTEGSPAML